MNQAGVVLTYSRHLGCETGVAALITSQIQKMQFGVRVIFRAIELVAADQIDGGSLRDEVASHATYVRPVAAAGDQIKGGAMRDELVSKAKYVRPVAAAGKEGHADLRNLVFGHR